MKLRDLFVSIGFDVDDKDLIRLDQGLEKTKSIILALGAAATASAGFLFGLAKSVADTGDKAAKTADKLGVDIEALQELRYAAELSGVAQNNLDTALQRMTRRAAEAAQGTGEAKDALRSLNVTLTDGQGRMRRSEDLLFDIADGLSNIHDPARRVALAFKLFDTEGVGMVNLLAKGSDNLRAMRAEARQLGVVLSTQVARDAEKFQDELLRSKSVIAGIKNAVGADLLPVFIELMARFRQWVLINRQVIKTRMDRFVKALIAGIGYLFRTVKSLIAGLAEVVELFGGIERVAKAAAWALGLFAGAQVLAAVGSLAMGLWQLLKVIRRVGNAALIANLKAAAIPVLIGAAIAAVILLLQDLYTYFNGGDSVIGTLLSTFEKKFPKAFSAAAYYVESFKVLIKALNDFLAGTVEYIMGILTLDWGRMTAGAQKMVDAFKPLIERWKQEIAAAVDYIKEKIQPLIDVIDKVRRRTAEVRDMIGDKAASAWQSVENFFSLGPDTAPVGNTVSRQTRVRVDAPVTVTVPEGTPAESVGQAVRQGVSDGIARMLRDTALATEPQVEY